MYDNLTWRIKLYRALDELNDQESITEDVVESVRKHIANSLIAFHMEYYGEFDVDSKLLETIENMTREFRVRMSDNAYTGAGEDGRGDR
jgi:hypothetical protein